MQESDRETVLSMMRTFYASPAVLTNGSETIFTADIDACVSDNPYLEGYLFRSGEICWLITLACSFSWVFSGSAARRILL